MWKTFQSACSIDFGPVASHPDHGGEAWRVVWGGGGADATTGVSCLPSELTKLLTATSAPPTAGRLECGQAAAGSACPGRMCIRSSTPPMGTNGGRLQAGHSGLRPRSPMIGMWRMLQ